MLVGERIDRIVATLTDLPRSAVADLVSSGCVLVGGRIVVQRSERVHEEAWLEVNTQGANQSRSPVPDDRVEFEVVHADEDLIIVDKPAGLVVHPGAGNPAGTLVNGLLRRFPEIAAVGDPTRPGIVHRLDKGTSGLMAVARSTAAFGSLTDQVSSHSMTRSYLALVWGHLDDDAGTIDAPLGRSSRQPTRMAVSAGGRPSRTHYRVVDRIDDPVRATMVECALETGRTHQIRVHMSAIGHPVLGDDRYAPRRSAKGLARTFLHSCRLGLAHPVTGDGIEFNSELPDDLVVFLGRA
ncbi:MAG: RluA family pseudouridine synthase [Acidimicrobiales bacterium]